MGVDSGIISWWILVIMLLLLMMQLEKTWVYCIRNKFDVFDTFNKWKALVENET
jgi:hypothetical protein